MLTKKLNNRLRIIAVIFVACLCALLMLIGMTPTFGAASAAEYVPSITFSTGSYTFLEAEEYNYIYLATDERYIESLTGKTIAYSVAEDSTAEYGTNFSSVAEGTAMLFCIDGNLAMRLNSVRQSSYDTGKKLYISLESKDINAYSIFGYATAEVTFKDKNPDGYVAITSENKTVYECDGSVQFTVQCSPNFFGTTVTFKYGGTAIKGEDYTAPDSVYLPAETTEMQVEIVLNDNNERSSFQKYIIVNLDTCSEGSEIAAIPNNTVISLNDDESIGVVSFISATDRVLEQDGEYALAITRTGGSVGELHFYLNMVTDAVMGVNYIENISGEYVFYDGEASKTVRLKLCEDQVYTGKYTFDFTLSQVEGYSTEFNITELELTREDSFYPSSIYIEAPKVNDDYIYYLRQGSTDYFAEDYYYVDICKTAGDNFSCKVEIEMQDTDGNAVWRNAGYNFSAWMKEYNSDNTETTHQYSENGLSYTISSDFYVSGRVARIFFPYNHTAYYTGDTNFVVRIYDLSAGVTVCGEESEYSVTVKAIETENNGVYALRAATVSGENVYIEVGAETVSSETVTGTVAVSQNSVTLAEYPLEFNKDISALTPVFPLVGSGYNAITGGQNITITLSMSGSASVAAGKGSLTVNTETGRGGTVGFGGAIGYWNIEKPYFHASASATPSYTLIEGGSVNVTLFRTFGAGLVAIDVPLYLVNPSNYFAAAQPVVTAHFGAGEQSGTATISLSALDGKLMGTENNYLYAGVSTTGIYNVYSADAGVGKTFRTNETTGYYEYVNLFGKANITVMDNDDYGKVGFAHSTMTMQEGESIALSLIKSGGIDTPVELYVVATNLSIIPQFNAITLTDSGYSLEFNYDDDVWHDSVTDKGYITLGIRAPVGNTRVNKAGLIENKETITIYLDEDELLGYAGFCVDERYEYINDGEYGIEINEDHENDMYINVFVKVTDFYPANEYSADGFFKYYIYTVAADGSKTIAACNMTRTEYYLSTRIKVSPTAEHTDNVIYIYLGVTRSDTYVLENCGKITVTVKDTMEICYISVSAQQTQASENEGEINWTLYRTALTEGDKTLSITNYGALITALSQYSSGVKMYVDDILLSNGSFVWQEEKESVQLSIKWQDDITQNPLRNDVVYSFSISAEQSQYCAVRWSGNITFSVSDNEVSGNIKWALAYASNISEGNSYRLESADGQRPYLAVNIDTTELYGKANNFSVYCAVEALDDNAEAFLGRATCAFSLWVATPGIGVLKIYHADSDIEYFESASFAITLTGNSINDTVPENATRYFTYYTADAAFNVNSNGLNTLSSRNDSTYITVARNGGLLHEVDIEFSLNEAASEAGYYLSDTAMHISAFDIGIHYLYIYSPAAYNDVDAITITANYTTGNKSYTLEYSGTLRQSGIIYYDISAAQNTVAEGGDIVFTVSRNQGTTVSVVSYSVASEDERVAATNGSLNFAIGETQKTFTVNTLSNTVIDGNYAFSASIASDEGDICRTASARVVVTDNDTLLSTMSSTTAFNEIFIDYAAADLNNDGLRDVVGILSNGKVVVYYYNGISFGVKKVSDTALSVDKDFVLKTGHVTADGAESVLVLYGDKVTIIKGNGDITITTYIVENFNIYNHIEVKNIKENHPGDEICIGYYYYYFDSNYVLQARAIYKNYRDLAKTYEVTLSDGSVLNGVLPIRISLKPLKQEYIACIDGALYAVFYSSFYDGYILSDTLATGVEGFDVSDLYGNGYGSVFYKAEGKTHVIQNFLGSSTFKIASVEYYCFDNDAYVEITVLREGLTVYEQSVGISSADITAVSGVDYTALSRRLIFASHETEKKVRINLKDSSALPSATLSFSCALITDNPAINISDEGREAVVYIYDTDNSGVVSIEPTAIFDETDGTVSVVLTRTKGAYDFTLDYTFTDRFLMQNGVDYAGINGSVTFAANEYSKTITFDIIDDDIYNISADYALVAGRKFVIVLSNARSSYNYALYSAYAPRFGNSEMTVSVTDDEKFAEKLQSAEGAIYQIKDDYDLNSDGKKDSYDISDSGLSITLSKDYSASRNFVYSMDDLRATYGNNYNSMQYSESLNMFVLYGISGGRTFKVSDNGLVLTGQISISGGSEDIFNSLSYVGDYDGDGSVDIAYFLFNESDKAYYLYYALSSDNYALTLATTYSEHNTFGDSYTIDTCQVKDITDDGCDDLLIRHFSSNKDFFAYSYILNTEESLVYECVLKNVSSAWEVLYDFYCVKISANGEYALCLVNVHNSYLAMAKSDTSGLYDLRVYLYDGEKFGFNSGYYFGASVYGDIDWVLNIDPMTGNEYLQSSKGYIFKLKTSLKALELRAQECAENDGYIYLTINNYSGKADVVNYYFVDDTAVNGHHYQCADGYVTFNAGETLKTIAVKLIDNNFYDGSKRFNVYLTSQNGQEIATDTVSVTISDNENTDLLLPEYAFYQAGVSFTYTVKSAYDIAALSAVCDDEMQVSLSGKTFTFNFEESGDKKVIIRGYDENDILIFYQEIIFVILPADSLYIDVNVPESIAGDSVMDITLRAYQSIRISYNENAYYYLADAEISFLNPFTMENVTVKADGNGIATYSLNVAGGDYGVYNIIFSGTSYLGNLTSKTVSTTVTNPNGEITGYVLLPDGNTGASGIKVKIAGKTATTDNDGFFAIAVTSGFTYTAIINAGKANSFYEEKSVTVQHNKTTSIISVSLVEIVLNALNFDVSYFYNEYLHGEKRTKFDSNRNSVSYAHDITNYTYQYGTDNLTMSNYFADGSELPAMTVNYPSSSASGSVSKVTRTFHNDGMWGSTYYTYSSSQIASFASRTELFFEFSANDMTLVPQYLRDLEFVVCDSNGNTLRTLTNVNYDWLGSNDYYTRYGDEAQGTINSSTNAYDFIYFINLTINSGDVNEGEILYIRRITNNDVMYYYTGITFGRSLAEKTRDDISEKFDSVKSESIANDLGFLSDCVFGIDLSNVDCAMVENSDGTVYVYLGYAATSYNLDIVPTTSKRSGSISMSQGNIGAEVSSESEIGIYFGGIFLMRYNDTLRAWEYTSGKAMFQGYVSNSTTLTFSYTIVMGIDVYVYTQITTGFVSNITVNVEDGVLVVTGSDEISMEIKVGLGISLTLVKGEIWGTVGGELQMYYGALEGTAMSITFTGGMTAYVLWFEFTQRWYSVSFEYQDTYTPTVIEQVSETLSEVTGSMGDGYAVPINDSGVIQGDIEEVAALEEMTLVERTIIGSTPTIVNFGNNKMLVYKQGVSYQGLTYQSLFYKVLKANKWSAARRVTSLVRNIGEFSVAVSSGVPIIAFTHTIADGNLATQMQYVDVSAAVYDFARDTFEVSEITNDSLPDANPLIVANDGHVILIFDKTYRNDYNMNMTLASVLFNERGLNYKMYCIYDGASFSRPEIFVRGAYNTIDEEGAIVGNKLYYAVIADMDGDITTDSDTEVLSWTFDFMSGRWSNYENITNNAYAETQLETVIQNGVAIYLWLNKYGINYSVGGGKGNVINTFEQGNITYFEVTAFDNNVVIAWTESTVNIEEEESNYVYFLMIDADGNVGRRKALLGTDQIIVSYALAATEDEVYAVYCMSSYDSTLNTSNVYSIESVRVPFIKNATAENIFTATGRWRAGETETVYFDITNYGDFPLNNIIVTVRANNQSGAALYTVTVNKLEIGETKTLSFSTVISEGLYGLFVTLEQRGSVSPMRLMSLGSSTLQVSQSSGISNINFSMHTQEITFESLKAVCRNNTVNVIAGIDNLGDIGTTGVIKLYVIKDFVSTLIRTENFSLAYGENADVLLQIATSELKAFRSNSGMISLAAYIESETADIATFAQNCSVMFKESFAITVKRGKDSDIIYNDTGVFDGLTAPTKTGYNFGGWYLDEALTIKAEFPMQLTGDITLYAKWTIKPLFVAGLSVGGLIVVAGAVILFLFLKKNQRYKVVILKLKKFFGGIKKKLECIFKKKGNKIKTVKTADSETAESKAEGEENEEERKND